MTKAQRISWIKRELQELETQESIQEQGLHGIKSRMKYLREELSELGALGSSIKKTALTQRDKNKLIASLTK